MKESLSIVACALFSLLLSGCNTEKPLSLKITHLNDTHSAFDESPQQIGLPDSNGRLTPTWTYAGGYPRLKTAIDNERLQASSNNQDFLLLHGGDAFSGSLFFTLYKSALNARFMNHLGFDSMVIGNHEFDQGNQLLADFADLIDFPLVSVNIKVLNSDPLYGKYLPYSIHMVGTPSQPIAVVGLTTEFTKLTSSPSDTTTFNDALASAQETVNVLTETGINKIVFLTHLGLQSDIELAKNTQGIDVIIGGHSPELLGNHSNIGIPPQHPSPILEKGLDNNPVCIMKSVDHSLALATTDIDFSALGYVNKCEAQIQFLIGDQFARGNPPLPVSQPEKHIIENYVSEWPNIAIVEKDHDTQVILDEAKLAVDEFSAQIIGASSTPLFHVRLPEAIHPTGGQLLKGSQVSQHVTLSMKQKMEAITGLSFISIINAGGIRSDLPQSISAGDVYTTLPYSSTLVTMKISGQNLASVLESGISNAYNIYDATFPYSTGLKYSINMSVPNAPLVSDIEVLNSLGSYEPIDPTREYNLVTTSYLTNGGDGYVFNGLSEIDTGIVDAESLSEYITSTPSATLALIENGITIIR